MNNVPDGVEKLPSGLLVPAKLRPIIKMQQGKIPNTLEIDVEHGPYVATVKDIDAIILQLRKSRNILIGKRAREVVEFNGRRRPVPKYAREK